MFCSDLFYSVLSRSITFCSVLYFFSFLPPLPCSHVLLHPKYCKVSLQLLIPSLPSTPSLCLSLFLVSFCISHDFLSLSNLVILHTPSLSLQ
jgi:hypothetical protein